MRLFPIFSRRIARELERRGFVLRYMSPNKYKPELNVYYFDDTVKLHNVLQELIGIKPIYTN